MQILGVSRSKKAQQEVLTKMVDSALMYCAVIDKATFPTQSSIFGNFFSLMLFSYKLD